MMKAILIPVEEHAVMGAALETALLLARRFDSYMEGVALGPDIADLVGADFSLSGIVADDRARRDFLDHGRNFFETFMAANKIPRQGADAAGPSFGWAGDALVSDNGIGEYGRIFDAIVVGRPGPGPRQPRRSTFEAALFESGRPVLIAPPFPLETLGETIVVIWNGSTDTARTIAFAMPLLARAKDVVVLNVPGPRLPGPTEDQLAKSLRRHGAPARVRLDRRGREISRRDAPGDGGHAWGRPARQGRLYAQPIASVHLRQRDERNPRRRQSAGLHGALRQAQPAGDQKHAPSYLSIQKDDNFIWLEAASRQFARAPPGRQF